MSKALIPVSVLEKGFQLFLSGEALPAICEALQVEPKHLTNYVRKRQEELDNGHFRNQAVQLARCERLFRELWDMLDEDHEKEIVQGKLSLISGMREIIKLENTILYDSRPLGATDARLGDVVDLDRVEEVLRKNQEERENAKREAKTEDPA